MLFFLKNFQCIFCPGPRIWTAQKCFHLTLYAAVRNIHHPHNNAPFSLSLILLFSHFYKYYLLDTVLPQVSCKSNSSLSNGKHKKITGLNRNQQYNRVVSHFPSGSWTSEQKRPMGFQLHFQIDAEILKPRRWKSVRKNANVTGFLHVWQLVTDSGCVYPAHEESWLIKRRFKDICPKVSNLSFSSGTSTREDSICSLSFINWRKKYLPFQHSAISFLEIPFLSRLEEDFALSFTERSAIVVFLLH